MSDTTCPRCLSIRVYRETRRVRRKWSGTTVAGWWTCRDCWHGWDGITDRSDGVLPAGVVARGKPELEEEEIK